MAKQIKAIKCPHCGSVQKTEIKDDHFRCDSCSTDYFLDNDDINININQKSDTSHFSHYRNRWLISIVGSVIGIALVSALIPSKNTQTVIVRTPTTTTTHQIKSEQSKPINFRSTYDYSQVVVDGNRAYILTLEKRTYSDGKTPYVFAIYDLVNDKLIKETLLDNIQPDKNNRIKWDYRQFSDNKTYFILNNREAYLLDTTTYNFTNVTDKLLESHSSYQTGVASIAISSTSSGWALHILTNDGKKAYYYPLIKQIYEDNYDFHMLKNRPEKPAPDTTEHVVYGFANNYGENNKLIRATYVSPDGLDHLEFRSRKPGDDKLGIQSGPEKHTDNEQNNYDLINQSNLDIKVTSHKNLTPDRFYFDPSVLYADKEHLIIKTKMNAAPDADYNFQSIDTKNGHVLWTIPENKVNIKEIQPFETNFIAKINGGFYAIIGNSGQIIKQIKLKGN